MITKLRVVLSITIVFLSFSVFAQQGFWQKAELQAAQLSPRLQPGNEEAIGIYRLDAAAFGATLAKGTAKGNTAAVYLPVSAHETSQFRVRESKVLAPGLARKYPGIRTFRGVDLEDPSRVMHFTVTSKGVHAVMSNARNNSYLFIEKAGDEPVYAVYSRKVLDTETQDFLCKTNPSFQKTKAAGKSPGTQKLVDDQVLRTYRIAVSASGEYTQYHGGTVTDALTAITNTLVTVNAVFETDLAVTLQLIAGTDAVIYTDASKDPYGGNLNTEVQNTLSNIIGEEDYDVGHLFHQGENAGNAGFIGSVCKDNQKGSAYSSALDPVGPVFNLDFVAHELGHQFGANHTWSFESEGTLVQAEPGSGSTIMGYAGIVPGNNVAPNGDDYFHYYSILQIQEYLATVNCGELTTLDNNPPVIVPLPDYVIPASTAFVLTANASDPDAGDLLTYAWEQIDNGVVTADTFGPENPSGANFRSRPPSVLPTRYFPQLKEIIEGNLTQTDPTVSSAWETVSTIERDLNFALTVRDNNSEGGQVAADLLNIQVVGNAGPFRVTSQQDGSAVASGTVQTITWDVAGTNQGVVNTQEVELYLSVDGGLSFPILLEDATPNDGEAEIQVPGVTTSSARIMVKAKENIFLAINDTNFSITQSPVVLEFPELEYTTCIPDDLDITFIYETFGGFNEESTFSVSGLPGGASAIFTPATATMDETPVTLRISGISGVAPGTYTLQISSDATGHSSNVPVELKVLDGNRPDVVLASPADVAQQVSLGATLEWEAQEEYSSYIVELATDPGFSNMVESREVLFSSFLPNELLENNTYYWRVKGVNECGEGTFGTAYSFSTIAISCKEKGATGLPVSISQTGTPTISRSIVFNEDLPVSDLDVNLDIDHTFLGDLVIRLTSPAGTEVVLLSNNCGEFQDLSATFDDDGIPIICGNQPAIEGRVEPVGSLASFKGESLLGEWVLTIEDTAPADGGALTGFSLAVCAEGEFRPDADGDGVFDDGDDLCLGTPSGTEVNTDGCPVYRFPPGAFQVSVSSESCRGSNDGMITIEAASSRDHTVEVNGAGLDITDNFDTTYTLGSLVAGTYTVCISASEGGNDFEPLCYELELTQPDPLSVISSLDGNQLDLHVEGADRYFINLNGFEQVYEGKRVQLELNKGSNSVSIYTDQSCQGVFTQDYYVPLPYAVYPNPVKRETIVSLDPRMGDVTYSIFSIHGKFLKAGQAEGAKGFIRIDMSNAPSGIYLLQLNGKLESKTLKIVKE